MLRRLLRAMLWGVKGVLLLVALAALVAWPWSYGHPGRLSTQRIVIVAGTAQLRYLDVGIGDGWIALLSGKLRMTDYSSVQEATEHPGSDWNPEWRSGAGEWEYVNGRTAGGVFGWSYRQQLDERSKWGTWRQISLSCWLLSLTAGAWPFGSLALLVRRRRRLRRSQRAACRCRACGYDLRASAERCPECGMKRRVALSVAEAGNRG